MCVYILLVWCVIALQLDIAAGAVDSSCVRISVQGVLNGELAVTNASRHVIFDVIETCGTGDVREVEFDVNRRLIGSNDWFVLCRVSGNRNASGCHCNGNRTYTTCAVTDEVYRYSTYRISSLNGVIVVFNVIVKPFLTTSATTTTAATTTTTTTPTTTTTTTVAPTTSTFKSSQSETHQQPTTETATSTEPTTSGFQSSDDAAVRFTFIPHGLILLVAVGFVIIVVVNVVVWRWKKKMRENTESERENLESQRQSSIYDEVQDPPPPPTTKPPLFKRKTTESPRDQSNVPIQNTNQSPLSATAFNQSASAIPAISQSAAEVQTVDAHFPLAPPTGHAFYKMSALESGNEQLAFGGDQRQVMNILDLLNRSLAEDSTGQENAATVLLNLQQRLAAFQNPGSHFHLQGGSSGNSPDRPAQDPAITFQGTPCARPPQANITANQIGPRANIDQSQSTLEDFDGYLQPIASQHTLSKQRVDAVKAKMSLRDTNLDKEKSSPTPCQTAADTYLNPVLSTKEAAGNKGTAFRDPTMIDDIHSLNHQQTLKAENSLQKPNTQEQPAYLTLIAPPEDEERYTTVQDTL